MLRKSLPYLLRNQKKKWLIAFYTAQLGFSTNGRKGNLISIIIDTTTLTFQYSSNTLSLSLSLSLSYFHLFPIGDLRLFLIERISRRLDLQSLSGLLLQLDLDLELEFL